MMSDEIRKIEVTQEDPSRTERDRDFLVTFWGSENQSTTIRMSEAEADILHGKMADELERRYHEGKK